jgi:hypothetical protein
MLKIKSTRLLPKVSFMTGVGSVLNIAGNYYQYNSSKSEADKKALQTDWQNVGDFLKISLKKVKPTLDKKR